jgi:hypothetical protein
MTITWGQLRRRNDRNEKAAGTEPDKHGSRSSEDRRERQKLRQALDAEISRTDPRRAETPLGWGGPNG